MSKDIEFIYTSEYAWNICEKPKPASSYIPQWFKEFSQYDSSDKLEIRNRITNTNVKKCRPMLDSLTSGYIIPLWSDVLVSRNQDNMDISWRVEENVFELHGDSARDIPAPEGYENIVFKYKSMLTIKTPAGYSVMITHPNNHYDLPFFIIPAVLDTDGINAALDFPLWIKKDFSGIIEKGTPMVQVTPFKRDNWKSKASYISKKESEYIMDREIRSTIKDRYLKKVWSKKEYR